MSQLAANGVDIYYERSGAGPRLLFLNGSSATVETSKLLIDQFRNDFEVAVHDQRGLGKTSTPPGPSEMADYAADAIALLDHLGWETANVIGVSFGGMVAQELAVTVPERVERLALLCTSPGGAGGSSYPLHELGSAPPAERLATIVRILDARFTPEWLSTHPGDQAIVDAMSARRQAEQTHGETLQLDARSRHDVWDRLPRITSPTLVAAGRYDGIAPLANSEEIASRIPKAELRVYDGGHPFFFQDRAAIPEIVDFLAGESPGERESTAVGTAGPGPLSSAPRVLGP